jgi:hypothetical protein
MLMYEIDHHEVYFSTGKGVKPPGKKAATFRRRYVDKRQQRTKPDHRYFAKNRHNRHT